MKKSILIIGAGAGLSQGIAEKFGTEGFKVALISRTAANLEKLQQTIAQKGIEVDYATADAGNAVQLANAISALIKKTSGFDVVLYNAAVLKQKDILEETSEDLTTDFTINVANAVTSLQTVYPILKERNGAFLLTGGGFGIHPNAQYGSLSLGKAGIRSLAYQLHDRLKDEGIFVGMVSIAGLISTASETHSPAILAEDFYKLYTERINVEIHH